MVRIRTARPAPAEAAAAAPSWLALAAAFLAAAALLFLRKPDALLHPQLFAEDGPIFFHDAYLFGSRSLLLTYAGYFHLAPRLVALAAMHVDPIWTPALYVGAALAGHLSVIAWLFSPRVALPGKPALAAAFLLAPHTGEVWLNLTNIQWSLALTLVLLAIAADPARPRDRWIDVGWLLLCGLTGPFLLFLLPVFALRALQRRGSSAYRWQLLASAVVIAAIQAASIYLQRAMFARTAPVDPPGMLAVVGARVFGTFFAGYRLGNFTLGPAWQAVAVAGGAVTFALAAYRGRWSSSRRAFAAAGACLVLPVALRFLRETLSLAAAGNGDRYFFLPHVLLGWLLVVAACELPRGWRKAPVVALLIALGGNLTSLSAPAVKHYEWDAHAAEIRAGAALDIPINPDGWAVRTPSRSGGFAASEAAAPGGRR